MSDSVTLKYVLEDGLNLYEELGFQVASPNDFQNLGVSELRKQYRSMALKHHPDKLSESAASASKFIRLKQAFEILSNPKYREQYNQWFSTRFFGNEKRKSLIRDLETREKNARKTTIVVPGSKLQSIQEHGLYLRKLRHFRKPYGDWKHIKTGRNREAQSHKLRDSCTLRIVATRSKATSKEAEVAKLFSTAGVAIHEVYFSSRNKDIDSELVFYVVLPDVATLKDFLATWSYKEPLKYHFLEVTPYINTQYFHFQRPVAKTDVSVGKH